MTATPETAPPPSPSPSLRGSVVRGTIWMVGAQWVTRGLGLLSTVVLARLLAPQDFGVVAMAMVVVGFLSVLFTFGIDTALIQNPSATREHWDAAWSVRIIQGLIMALLLLVAAPLAAWFYGEPRVIVIMLFLAVGSVAGSLENIGVVAFRKELQFHRDFQYTLARKILQLCVTLPIALVWRNYWALLIGIVAGQVFSTAISYAMHPFRPRWSLKRAKEIWGFTSRMAFINLSQYMTFEGERLIVGALTGARLTGIYAMSNDVSNIPTTEMIGSISRATVPGLAKLKQEPERLRAAYLNVLGMVALFSLPAGAGVALVSQSLVTVMLGAQWTDAIPVVKFLAIAGAVRALASPSYNLLIVLGRLNAAAIVSWSQSIGQIVLLGPAITYLGIVGAAGLNSVLACTTLLFYAVQVARLTDVSLRDHLSATWRPMVATVMMVMASYPTTGLFSSPAVSLVLMMMTGAVCYLIATLLLWFACGRPQGPEHHLFDLVLPRLGLA